MFAIWKKNANADVFLQQENLRRSQSSQRWVNNKNTSSNTENSSCLDSLNLYLLLTYGMFTYGNYGYYGF